MKETLLRKSSLDNDERVEVLHLSQMHKRTPTNNRCDSAITNVKSDYQSSRKKLSEINENLQKL